MLFLLASPATAEVVRVAVTRGPRVIVEGAHLILRGGGARAMEADGRAVLEAVGPFVSTGDRLDARFSIEEATGGPLKLNGVPVIGGGEVAAVTGGVVGIDAIDLERYVASVVGAEMPSSWPAAALEAQAIAARTYVLSRRANGRADAPFDVEATVQSQVYSGHASIREPSVAAAESTRGEVVIFDGRLADTFFFASCVGKTESAAAAFGAGELYLTPTSCETDAGTPGLAWKTRISVERLSTMLRSRGATAANLTSVSIADKTATGRVAGFQLGTARGSRVMKASELRQIVGAALLPSLDAAVFRQGDDIVFTGRGAGHGVGLCQWGARSLAARGATAQQILQHYYPGTRVGQLPVVSEEQR